MRKRLAMAMATGALVAASLPGVVSADPVASKKTQICHFPGHHVEVLTTVGPEILHDYYYDVPGGVLTAFFEEACGWFGGQVISVSNRALDGHRASGRTSLPTD